MELELSMTAQVVIENAKLIDALDILKVGNVSPLLIATPTSIVILSLKLANQ